MPDRNVFACQGRLKEAIKVGILYVCRISPIVNYVISGIEFPVVFSVALCHYRRPSFYNQIITRQQIPCSIEGVIERHATSRLDRSKGGGKSPPAGFVSLTEGSSRLIGGRSWERQSFCGRGQSFALRARLPCILELTLTLNNAYYDGDKKSDYR